MGKGEADHKHHNYSPWNRNDSKPVTVRTEPQGKKVRPITHITTIALGTEMAVSLQAIRDK
jgi:hypothetical protein